MARTAVRNKRVLVMGLGRFGGGLGVTQWLCREGAKVSITDRAGVDSLAESLSALADCDVTFRLGGHDVADLESIDLVVVNPAVVKSRSSLFHQITRRGLAWTTETNLFCERCPAPVIGVTGTFGKSTTATMLAHTLQIHCRSHGGPFQAVHLGGNIGRSLLPALGTIRPADMVVLELSSAQLEDLPHIGWAPHTAVITNLSPHHLDRYESYGQYLTCKLNIVGDRNVTRHVIVGNVDAKAEQAIRQRLPDDDRLVRVRPPDPLVDLRLPGPHNQANAACVLTVFEALGLDPAVAREALRTWPGLPHRIEYIRTVSDVDYYNDSKSTSPATTIAAVAAFDRPIVAIVGGQDKRVALEPFARALVDACRAIVCTGESGPAFARAIRTAAKKNRREVPVLEADSLAVAVTFSGSQARSGDIVLFSPGAPSFDAYDNFARRGEAFVRLVERLE